MTPSSTAFKNPKQEVSSNCVHDFENWNVKLCINISEITNPRHISFSGLGMCKAQTPQLSHFPVYLTTDTRCLPSPSQLCHSLCPLIFYAVMNVFSQTSQIQSWTPASASQMLTALYFLPICLFPQGRCSLSTSTSLPYKAVCKILK